MIKCSTSCGWPKCSCEDNPDPRSAGKALVYPLVGLVIIAVVLVAGALLSGCAVTPKPTVRATEIQTVTKEVSRSCVPAALGGPPVYVDTDAALRAAPAAEDRFTLLAAGRIQRQDRLGETEPVIAACR